MGVNTKPVRRFAWEVLRFSMNAASRFIVNHPVFSAVSFFLLLLHIFLPSVFLFLVYVSPILVSTAIYARYYPKPGPRNPQNEKKKKDKETSSDESMPGASSGDVKPCLTPQRSVRRNARRKIEEIYREPDCPKDERDKIILTTLYNDLLGRKPHFEESPKAPRADGYRGGESSSALASEPSESLKEQIERFKSEIGETEVESSEEEEEDRIQDEEDQKKAVEWTEDDQKNLMDLGLSEIERNKRLENLMARRRARELFHWAAVKALLRDAQANSGCQVPPVSIQKGEYDVHDGLRIPGSAPSRLLKAQNPFDLPYDPQEEKPDLMGDSFYQDFAMPNQKDTFYSRHESFCRNFFPPELAQEAKSHLDSCTEREAVEGSESSTSTQTLETHDLLGQEDRPLSADVEPVKETNVVEAKGSVKDGNREVRIETDSIRKNDSDSSSAVSTRQINRSSTTELGDRVTEKIFLSEREPSYGLSSHVKQTRSFGEDYTGRGHSLTPSTDSDLQVEVSEIGWPLMTAGENDSVSDGERDSFIYEREGESIVTFDGDEAKSKPVNLTATPEQREAHRGSSPSSLAPQTEETIKVKEQSFADSDGKAGENVKHMTDNIEDDGVLLSSISFSHKDSEKGVSGTGGKPVLSYHELFSEKQEEAPGPSQNLADEMKVTYRLDDADPPNFTTEAESKIVEGYLDREMDEHNTEVQHQNLAGNNMQESEVSEALEVDADPPRFSPSSSPKSVLVDNLTLDQEYSMTSEELEHVVDSQNNTVVNSQNNTDSNTARDPSSDEQPEVESTSMHGARSLENYIDGSLNRLTSNSPDEEMYDMQREANITVEDTGKDETITEQQDSSNLNALGGTEKKEEDGDSAGKVPEEANITDMTDHPGIKEDETESVQNHPEIDEVETRSVETSLDMPQLSTRQNEIVEQPKTLDGTAPNTLKNRNSQAWVKDEDTGEPSKINEHEDIAVDPSEQAAAETIPEVIRHVQSGSSMIVRDMEHGETQGTNLDRQEQRPSELVTQPPSPDGGRRPK